MRKYTRNQTKELLATIRSGLKYAAASSTEDALGALGNCHAIAQVAERNLIAELNPVRAVHYRRLMRTLTKNIEETITSAPRRTMLWDGLKIIRTQISLIENELDNEPEICTEIAFMPVFAEQWVAMDSIWRAAKQDSRCVCTVVPLPYYQRSDDGRLGRKIYEGRFFPEYLEVTHFEKYNLEKHRPDIIYIQNADDDAGAETVLPECYFTASLKQYGGKLVYVPPELTLNPSRLRGTAPGLTNVDIVIAQSEEERRIYPYLQSRRVLALGSPLVDNVLLYKSQHRELPRHWEDTLGMRRIILLSTDPNVLLDYGEAYIDKIEKIIVMFEQRKDVALLWRPRLISGALLSRIPSRLLKSYRALIDAYKESGIGVYDDSADYRAALAASDAFLGDRCDEMILYGLAGKPAMLQYVDLYTSPASELTLENAFSYASDDPLSYFFHESPVMSIPDFMDYVSRCDGKPNYRQAEAFKNLDLNSDGRCGEEIHKAVIS